MKNFAIVILADANFGGAQRRFINLFFFLRRQKFINSYLIITSKLKATIKNIFPLEDEENILIIDNNVAFNPNESLNNKPSQTKIRKNKELLKKNIVYKIYYNKKYKRKYKTYYNQLEIIRNQYNIKSFLGLYDGIFPLYFYFNKSERPGIIFCNMDSWFSNISENPKRDWYRKFSLFNYAHEKADYVDFLSPFILEGVRERGIQIPDKRALITACSFTDYSKCRIGTKAKFIVAFASRLEKDKNPLMFIDVAIHLSLKFPEVEFHIMGDGRLSNEIHSKVSDSGLQNIIFHGFHPNPVDIFAESSIFVSIQTTNNYPSQSVLEAMACGNVTIATDVGDTRMFVNEENGTLIPLDLNALIEAIEYYIENKELANKKGFLASLYVKKEFTIEKAAKYYLDLFEMACNKENQKL